MWSTNVFAQGGGTPAAGDKKAGDAKAGDAKAGDAKAGDAAGGAAAGGAAAGGAAAGGAGDQAAAPSGGDYNVRLKQLEARVNELKERIFRSKARLNLLKETVLHGVIAGSRAIIKHKNEMGSSFRLVKLVYAVDGAQIFSKTDD
ncbi:MAG: hypothetical protein KC503_21335, partial [Myxococcales bacterium]|nr:hypothetical protein [Myxococcales bacterium]